MMGYVTRVPVKVGQQVRRGQLLASIQNEGIQAKMAQASAGIAEATAAFENAQKDFQRFENLFEAGSASRKELDDMRSRYEMARARLNAAQEMKKEVQAEMSYVEIRAPFNGQVTQTFVEAGDLANPGMPLVAMENPDHFEVRAMIPENEVASVKEGDRVEVTVKSIDAHLSGSVSELSGSAMGTGGQYLVTISLPEAEAGLRSGMYASVRFPRSDSKTAGPKTLLIPKEALVTRGQLTGVYTVSQNERALLRWVRLGREFGEQVEVLSGLQSGESLVVSADSKLFNGAPIKVQ
jgi:RND family efflux transporter MFP subunit